jgi:hypothetical protein
MVAKVISGQNIKGALNYNEQKVMEGKATCIQTNLFKHDLNELNFNSKLSRFTELNERNQRTKTNTLHISLNFDVGEKLSVEVLNNIASTYMDKIGFGEQPYLVYEHHDAAHPHLHIVTTLITSDGNRIPIHYLGKNQSEKARKEIEIEFGLVQAQRKATEKKVFIHPIEVQKAMYGKSETKRSITNIVSMVTRSYKYTSLPELNAILRQFNVIADRGAEKSKMYKKNGLVYSLMDDKGKRIGVPIKASAIYGKPTMAFLVKQFKLNAALREGSKTSIRRFIDRILQYHTIHTKASFKNALEKNGIAVIFRTNSDGRTYGVTFVDNKSRVVFNGSDLGKAYSANAIQEKLSLNEESRTRYQHDVKQGMEPSPSNKDNTMHGIEKSLLELIATTEFDHTSPEAALRLRKKKRKKGRR